MNPGDYPALFRVADADAIAAQRAYLRSLQVEYVLLLLASIFSLGLSQTRAYQAGYALTFLALIGIVVYRSLRRPEQSWYRARALAESIKTTTWRFAMRAHPFADAAHPEVARQAFAAHLSAILQANPRIGRSLAGSSADESQVTPRMEAIGKLPLEARQTLYRTNRIEQQRTWYVARAARNRRAFRLWMALLIVLYTLGTIVALMRVAFPATSWIALDPLIVLAASLVGWIQVKKFSELAASYTLTAHEIAIVAGRANEAMNEVEFSDFVNEAELAFSREHTQWVARQQSSGP